MAVPQILILIAYIL